MKYETREEWLTQAIIEVGPIFTKIGKPLPNKVRVACGWPSNRGTSSRNKVVGQCWHSEATEDNIPQIFISPVLYKRVEVLDCLVHELIHAMGVKGHKKDFKAIATAVGLEGKMTATVAGAELKAKLEKIADKLEEYPHSQIDVSTKPKQSTRLLKAWCPECGYTVRVTRKWLEIDAPTCSICEVIMESELYG